MVAAGKQGLKDGRLGRVGKPTGLSQAEPEAGLGPSGFDPSRIAETIDSMTEAEKRALLRAPPNSDFWYVSGPIRRRFLSDWLVNIRRREAMRLTDFGRAVQAALRDSDGSPKGEDALAASSETTARAEGIAPTDAALSKVQPL